MFLALLMVLRSLLGYLSAFALVCNVVIISVPFWTSRLSSTSAARLRSSCGSTSSLSACFDVLTMHPSGDAKQAQSPYVTRTHGSVGEVWGLLRTGDLGGRHPSPMYATDVVLFKVPASRKSGGQATKRRS